jgi:plasmid stability protein
LIGQPLWNHYGCPVPSLTLKDLPRKLHRELKSRARLHHRSLNKEVLATLEGATNQSPPVDPAAMIREARAIRKKFRRQISPAQIRAWIQRGRL